MEGDARQDGLGEAVHGEVVVLGWFTGGGWEQLRLGQGMYLGAFRGQPIQRLMLTYRCSWCTVCEEAAIGDADDVVVGVEVGEGHDKDQEHAMLCLVNACEMSGMMRREGTCLLWASAVLLEEVDGVVKLGLGVHVREGGIQLKGCDSDLGG